MKKRRDDQQTSANQGAQLTADRSEFSAQFARVCQEQVRPAMDAIIERLRPQRRGVIEEYSADYRYQNHRLIMSMSLDGEIVGTPAAPLKDGGCVISWGWRARRLWTNGQGRGVAVLGAHAAGSRVASIEAWATSVRRRLWLRA